MAPTLPITFLSDYGLDDEFVAVCKGVMWQVVPDARVLDVTHSIVPGNVRAGALAYLRAIQYLPSGVHLAVIDPGVGTDRKAIALEAADGRRFVGPDNGVLSPAVTVSGGAVRAVVLEPSRWGVDEPSATFHGRDVFAPATGALAGGDGLDEVGTPVDPAALTPLLLPLCQREGDTLNGIVFWIDRFGNVQTNVSEHDLDDLGLAPGIELLIRTGGIGGGSSPQRLPLVRTFGDVEPGRLLAYVDSVGQLAVSVSGGNASEELGMHEGQPVSVEAAPRRLL